MVSVVAEPVCHLATGVTLYKAVLHQFTELAYHFFALQLKYNITHPMYSLYTVYIILHSKLLICFFRFPNFFQLGLKFKISLTKMLCP